MMFELGSVFGFYVKEDLRWFGHHGEMCGHSVVVHWLFVYIFVCFIAAICLLIYLFFCVCFEHYEKFLHLFRSHHQVFFSCLSCLLGEGGVSFSCSSADGLVSCLFRVIFVWIFVLWLLEVCVALIDHHTVLIKLLLVSVLSVLSSVGFLSFVVLYVFWVSLVFFAGSISVLC
jgi:hypothetical protein